MESKHQIKIFNADYEVRFVDRTECSALQPKEDGEVVIGLCCYVNQIIYIDNSLNKLKTKQTLIHELTHGFLGEYGFNFANTILDEECICDFVGVYAEMIVDTANSVIKEREAVVNQSGDCSFITSEGVTVALYNTED